MLRRRAATVSVALLCALLAAVIGPAGAQESRESAALRDARRRVAAVSSQLDAARAQAADAAAALEHADRQLREVEDAVNQAAEAVAHQQLAVDEAAERLQRTEAHAESVRSGLETRAVELFKRGGTRSYEVLLSSGDISEALERTEFVRVLTLTDRGQLERLVAATTAVAAERVRLEAEREHLVALELEQRALLEEVARLRDDAALRAAAARDRASALSAQLDTLERDAQRLTTVIRSRATPSRTTGSPSTSGYAWPRCDTVTSEYGRRWGRLHAGLDIDGDTGEGVFASKAGTVIFASWQGGYGRLVLIDHGDGVVTAYAHLSAFSVGQGQRVSRGDRVGSVGTSGSSTGSHLHFETRVNGSPVNPRRFLPSGC